MTLKQTQLHMLAATLFAMIGAYLLATEGASFFATIFHIGGFGDFRHFQFEVHQYSMVVGSIVRALAGLAFIAARNRLAESLVFSAHMYKAVSTADGATLRQGQTAVTAEEESSEPADLQPRQLWSEIVPALALAFIGWLFIVEGVSSLAQSLVSYSDSVELQWQPFLHNRNTLLFPILLALAKSLIGMLLIRRRTAIVDLWQRHRPLVKG